MSLNFPGVTWVGEKHPVRKVICQLWQLFDSDLKVKTIIYRYFILFLLFSLYAVLCSIRSHQIAAYLAHSIHPQKKHTLSPTT